MRWSLKDWVLLCLKMHSVRGDLIQMYKRVKCLDETKWENDPVIVSVERISTRSHS